MIDLDDIFITSPNETNLLDIVYTYVDPYDKKWQQKYSYYTKNRPNSYRFDFSKEQIQFSLSTIEKFAPWINKIYIIHDDQEFSLNSSFLKNKVVFIDHTKIIPYEYLPTFNSIVIECFLWNVPELSKNFVYFNDDVFLGSNIFINDFFTQDNKLIQFFNKFRDYSHPWIKTIKRTNEIMQSYFPDYTNFIAPQHSVYAINKELMEKCFIKFFSHFEELLTKDKIRTYNSYVHNLHFLYAMYASYLGEAINKNGSFKAFYNITEDHINQLKNKKHRKKFYCFHRCPRNEHQNKMYNRLTEAILSSFF